MVAPGEVREGSGTRRRIKKALTLTVSTWMKKIARTASAAWPDPAGPVPLRLPAPEWIRTKRVPRLRLRDNHGGTALPAQLAPVVCRGES